MNRSLLLAALLALTPLPLACKSTEGHDRAAETANQVVEIGGIAGQTQLRLDNTLAALEKVVATANQDPKPAFDTFAKEFNAFSSEFASLTKERESLKTKAELWFTEFAKKNDAIQDADLRKDGTKRLAEFREQVGDLSKQVDTLMTGTSALEAQIRDLRTFLGNDLTKKGIDTASGRIEDTAKNGRKVASGLGKLSKASEEIASKMRAATPPAK